MLRISLALALVCALASPALSLSPLPSPVSVPGFHGLRIPAGGVDRGAQPGGGGRIVLYTYSIPKTSLDTLTRQQLKADGWAIVSDQRSPRGTVRLVVSKGGAQVRISVTGHGPQSALILTR